ncbi:hypothetical protein GCM10022206_44910 [Streptomyces chiangmaiensis]
MVSFSTQEEASGGARLTDADWGRPGRRALQATSADCARGRMSLSLAAFGRPAGEGLRV